MKSIKASMQYHLESVLIPFWKGLKDETYGGYYGYVDHALKVNEKAEKGCILNSRITWFFSNAYLLLKDPTLLEEAKHGFDFLVNHCMDKENKGLFWSLNYDGTPNDTSKHTYNQAFAIYALSSYYDASKDIKALELAEELYQVIESKCKDEFGYVEAMSKKFVLEANDKLSENGVMADKTMNTLLHVLEAYTELYRVNNTQKVKNSICEILDIWEVHVFEANNRRQAVFFDQQYHSILDIYSYGHDIETAWLMDRSLEVIQSERYRKRLSPLTSILAKEVYETAYRNHSLANECVKGVADDNRVWWVQAEAVVGFYNEYQKNNQAVHFLQASYDIWQYINDYLMDKRPGGEWFWELDKQGSPIAHRPIVEPWKCPYHNGRMCFEIIRRTSNDTQ